MERTRSRLRPLERYEEAAVGAVTGSCEVFCMQPTVYWKSELQQGRFDIKRAVQPRYLYRGTSIAATSIAPITAIQFSVNGACMSRFGADGGVAGTLLSGVAAGVVSSIVQSPCQLVEINQQKHGGSMGGIVKRVVGTHGVTGMWRGLSMTAAREGIFCCSYISTAPMLAQQVNARTSLGNSASTVAGAVMAGSLAALLTHPADTLKTRLQGDLFAVEGSAKPPVNVSIRAAVADMVATGGVICCTFIYGRLNDAFSTALAGPLECRD